MADISLRHARTEPCRLHAAGWIVTASLGSAALLALAAAGLPVDWPSGWQLGSGITIFCGIGIVYRTWRSAPRLSRGCECAAQLLLMMLGTGLLTYGTAVLGADIAYVDDALARADRLLGLDWRGMNNRIMDRPWLARPLGWAYLTISWQFALAIVALAGAGQLRHLEAVIFATGLTLVATCAIFPFLPALGYHAWLGQSFGEPQLMLEALRHGTLAAVHLERVIGIVTFPSFHTAGALLLVWAFWPLRWLRWPALLLNTAMLAATPFCGSHYFVDMIAGALIAVAAIALARPPAAARSAEACP